MREKEAHHAIYSVGRNRTQVFAEIGVSVVPAGNDLVGRKIIAALMQMTHRL